MFALILIASLAQSDVGLPGRSDGYATPDRTWLGNEFWANRLQDWVVEDREFVCVEARPRRAVRTAHWLGRSTDPADGDFMVRTVLRTADGTTADEKAFAGLLIGCGGDHVDHRLTAQTHHVPAEDGGLLVVVDGNGRIALRRFDQPLKGGGQWSIQHPTDLEDLPEIETFVSEVYHPEDAEPSNQVELEVNISEEGHVVARTRAMSEDGTFDMKSDTVLARVMADDVPRDLLEGGIALVSHRGPTRGGRGFAFDFIQCFGDGVTVDESHEWGPVLNVLYTVDGSDLTLTTQFPPVSADTLDQPVFLELTGPDGDEAIYAATIDPHAFTATFRVEDRDASLGGSYVVTGRVDGEEFAYAGTIRAAPDDGHLDLAAMNCQKVYTGGLKWNHDGLWLPHVESVDAVASHDPDMLFFAGDQIYEGDLTPVDGRGGERTRLDYLYKWYRWCWAFGALTRDRPTVVIPDDHDVYHGNIWGAGGRKAQKTDNLSAQDSGGYKMPPDFVNMVHRTQTSNLPGSLDPPRIDQDITTYHTDIDWGGMSFLVLADRMYKSSPSVAVPEGRFRNGWPQAEGFDARTQADVPGAELLGPDQEALLTTWANQRDDRWAACVLSQTLFANLATLPPGGSNGSHAARTAFAEPGFEPTDWHLATDGDSNGWPQTPRNRAVRLMADAGAVHVCGDQHLGSLVQYGVDAHGDGSWAFCVPAVSNTWPRRWWPPEPGANPAPGAPRYTGEHMDGFGNLVTVHAVANPVLSGRRPANLHDRMPGWGMVRFDRDDGTVTFECWRRPQLGVNEPPSQFHGWPVTAPLPQADAD